MARVATFADWVDLFKAWQEEIGYEPKLLGDYTCETKFGELESPEIQFGAFAGEPKWDNLRT